MYVYSFIIENRINTSTSRIFGGAIGVSAFLNMFIPGACHVSPSFVMFVRILQGLVEVSTGALHDRVTIEKKTSPASI